jgi:RNA recognition motif-containing protein
MSERVFCGKQWMPEADVKFVENHNSQWIPLNQQWTMHAMYPAVRNNDMDFNNAPLRQPTAFVVAPPARKVAPLENKALENKALNTRAPTSKAANRKKMDLTKLNPPPSNYSGITTLMIRGIPCSFTQEDLLNLVVSAGLGDTCDFFYLPRAGNTPSNLGYAFINFTETIHAWTCAFTFNGIRLDPAHSSKTCSVSPADIQGIPNLRKHFRRTVVSRGQNGPLFLCDKRNNNLKIMMQRARRLQELA